jgi:hypothetical protein
MVWADSDTSAVDELRGGTDEPDRHERPERHVPEASRDSGAARARIEPRSRAEYAADLERLAVPGWDQQPSTSLETGSPHDLPGSRDVPLEVVRRFEPGRAGLADISSDDAAAYIHARQDSRPWLAAASGWPPDVQRVFAALDQGGGHGHIRHEGWVTEEMNHRRVAYLEDPAQPDPVKRAAGIDGLRPGDQPHRCRQTATRITDPGAFAVGFARGIEHPKVRTALETPFHPDSKPFPAQLPIAELLGPDGHRYCTGWRLEPVDGSMTKARASREAWMAAPADQRALNVGAPTARPVETFKGGTAVFVFGHNSRGDGYEVLTMYPRPPDQDH